MTDDQPPHLRYVIDLASFSMILRPGHSGTDVIQFPRSSYNVDAAEKVFREVFEQRPVNDLAQSAAAAFVFAVLFKTDRLNLAYRHDGTGTHAWLVQDVSGRREFDFSNGEIRNGVEFGTPVARPTPFEADGCPTEAAFDLLDRVVPDSRRYRVDERMTAESLSDSEFVTQKQAMDYLYQNGVFGTFEDL